MVQRSLGDNTSQAMLGAIVQGAYRNSAPPTVGADIKTLGPSDSARVAACTSPCQRIQCD
jgi:hypothetical protein